MLTLENMLCNVIGGILAGLALIGLERCTLERYEDPCGQDVLRISLTPSVVKGIIHTHEITDERFHTIRE